jgi:O-antigen ligase
MRAVNAAIAAAIIGYWLWRLPARADRTDLLVVAALITFLITCVASDYRRMSFDAATSALAYAGAFSVARWEVADRRSARALVTVLGISAIGLILLFLPLWVSVWAQWVSITGSFPSLDLNLPVGPYRGFHVVGMLFALLLPALIQMTQRRLANLIGFVGIGLSLILIYMSGSRTVWLAVVVGAVAPLMLRMLNRRRLAWSAGIAILLVVALAMVGELAAISDRLLTSSTIGLRLEIWGDALGLWLQDPVFGSGPGSFSAAFTLSGYFADFERVGRHADSAMVQVLMEGGIVGLVAVGLIIAALVIGIRDADGRWTRPALMGAAIFVLMSFTDNPSDTSNLTVLGICWAALSTPAIRTPITERWWPSWRTALIGAGAGVVATSVIVFFAAAFAFDASQASARAGAEAGVVKHLDEAVAFDPGNALYWRERGIHRAAAALPGAASDLQRAIALVPGDTGALRGLAIVSARNGDHETALAAARRAAALRPTHEENLTTLAWTALESDELDVADEALVDLLRRMPWIAASHHWPDVFPDGSHLVELEQAAADAWDEVPVSSRSAMARVWAKAAVDGNDVLVANGWDAVPYLVGVDRLLRCDIPGAHAALADSTTVPGDEELWVAIMLSRITGDNAGVDAAVALADLRDSSVAALATKTPEAQSPVWDPDDDRRIYHRDAVVPADIGLILPTGSEATSRWLQDPRAAARAGAPASALASCSG